ncbi:MAG TPA: serine/threonine-protein kinase, partial [Herpetosiphonaceae bacterium]
MIKAGDVLQGRYAIVRPLGSGGFGSVFLATDSRLGNRNVAIKYFATAHMRPDEAAASAQLFQGEAHTLANLSHPNLTAVLDYFEVEGGWVLVMGYVPGDSLAAVQQRLNGPFGEEQVIDWAIELCNVLDYLHRQKPPLVFRDLKPSNIMRTPEGKLMLIDFGIVRSFKEGQHQDTVQLGTPGYAPPEQYGGQTEPRSDLYSLGATLYVLLTGERVTGGFSVPSVRARSPWVSERLDQLIQRLTALRPQDRPASAAAVRAELENLKAAPPGRPAALPAADPAHQPGGNDQTGQQPRVASQQTGQQP